MYTTTGPTLSIVLLMNFTTENAIVIMRERVKRSIEKTKSRLFSPKQDIAPSHNTLLFSSNPTLSSLLTAHPTLSKANLKCTRGDNYNHTPFYKWLKEDMGYHIEGWAKCRSSYHDCKEKLPKKNMKTITRTNTHQSTSSLVRTRRNKRKEWTLRPYSNSPYAKSRNG